MAICRTHICCNFGTVVILSQFISYFLDSARVCYSCTGMAESDKCQHVETCHDKEVCYTRKYRTNDNITRYDVGCSYSELCRKDISGVIFGKRAVPHSHVTCHRCCDTDICNSDISCNDDFTAPKLLCASCSEIESPNLCRNTTLCDDDEICTLNKYTTETKQLQYDLGCKRSVYCLTGQSSDAAGRRTVGGRHLICEACCRGSALCNLNLHCDHHTQETINGSCTTTNDCTGNLICTTGKCQCPSDEYFWSNSTCELRRNVNQLCSSARECKLPFICSESVCSCPTHQYWNGSHCNERKILNSYCKLNKECQDTLLCGHGVCKCDRIDYWTGKNCSTKPKECADVLFDKDGVYDIYLNEYQSIKAYCIKDRNELWTVIQRRFSSSTDFSKTWLEYKIGFGNVSKDHWIEDSTSPQARHTCKVEFINMKLEVIENVSYGNVVLLCVLLTRGTEILVKSNENIHLISSNGRHKLRVLLTDTNGKTYYADYSTFRVDDENSKYRLTVTGYSGTAGDSMDKVGVPGRPNGKPFTTKDRDNDNHSVNCASIYHGGWWYSNCDYSDLNGRRGWSYSIGTVTKSVMMVTRH